MSQAATRSPPACDRVPARTRPPETFKRDEEEYALHDETGDKILNEVRRVDDIELRGTLILWG